MAGYAVIAGVERVDPHLAGRRRASADDWPVTESFEGGQAVELVGRPLAPAVTERWTRVREAWAQTTFYLFDAEGWR